MNLLTDTVYWVAAALALVGLLGGAWLSSMTPRRGRGFLPNIAVLVAAHGVPGSMSQWYSTFDMRELGDPVVAAGKVHRFITVIPNLTPDGVDSECVYGPDGPDQLETWLTKDIPDWVHANFRAAPERDAWAWMGFSAGGWCSAMATMLHPDRFAAASGGRRIGGSLRLGRLLLAP